MVNIMSYVFDEETKTYQLDSKLSDDELYDALLGIAKVENVIEANHASDVSHMFSILRGSNVEISLVDVEE